MTTVGSKADVLKVFTANHAQLTTFGVRRLGLFGSFGRDEGRSNSDVDLLVEFADGHKTFDNFMALSFWLEDALGRQVELVTLESLSPYIGPHILEEVEYVFAA